MKAKRIGRPRSEKSREAVIAAADELLNESDGRKLTIEAIARRAGVGKPTIYRWWPSLADVVLEVLLSQASAEIKVPSCETVQETLRLFLRQSMQTITAGVGVHLCYLMAQAQVDDEFRIRFREKFTNQRRRVLYSILQQAVYVGELERHQNLDLLVDIVFGAMWYRLLLGHLPMDESFADELTGIIFTKHA